MLANALSIMSTSKVALKFRFTSRSMSMFLTERHWN